MTVEMTMEISPSSTVSRRRIAPRSHFWIVLVAVALVTDLVHDLGVLLWKADAFLLQQRKAFNRIDHRTKATPYFSSIRTQRCRSTKNSGFQATLAVEADRFQQEEEGDSSKSPNQPLFQNEEEESASFVWTRQWYPILPVENAQGLDLETKPWPFQVLGEKLVLWRSKSNNKYSVMQDTCPHRRAPLSTGKVVTRTISDSDTPESSGSTCSSLVCRYHGWEFNEKGTCTKIPMAPANQTTSNSGSNKFSRIRVPSYQVKEGGGLLWVFMDPFVDESKLPDLPDNAVIPKEELESGKIVWVCWAAPVSYLSMLENSFDPTHAPFVHEGIPSPVTGLNYSPDMARPMETCRLVTPMTAKEGFTVEHSPYIKVPQPKGASNNETSSNVMMTTRQFVPPCINYVRSPPFFDARLFFVPSTPTKTTTISYFEVLSSPTMERFDRIQKVLLPQSCRNTIANWRHVFKLFSGWRNRFARQDAWTMQGQDERKIADLTGSGGAGKDRRRRGWDDMILTPSDAGVAALQKWMHKFGNGGPFPLYNLLKSAKHETGSAAEKLINMESSSSNLYKSLSLWEAHAKFCPQCQAVLRQASSLERRLKQFSALALAFSAIGTVLSIVMSRRNFLLQHQQHAPVTWFATSVLSMILSVTSRSLSDQCQHLQQRFFAKGENDKKNYIMDYTYEY